MKPKVTMREALTDPQLLGGAIPGPSWLAWRVLLIAALGEPLTDDERETFAAITSREREPLEPVEELLAIIGRRAGKTRAAGVLAAYVGVLCDHRGYLAGGERGSLPLLAASQQQAGRAFQHVQGVLEGSPVLSREIADVTSDSIRLRTRVDVEVRAASFKTIRGMTAVAAIADEACFWAIEGSSNPDTEVLAALRPALATTGGPLWIITSPYGKRGEAYETWRRHFGPAGDARILVAQAPSRLMNCTLPQSVIDRAYERDAAVAASEFGAQWRNDIEQFVAREVVEACVARGVKERGPIQGTVYCGFADPSGGGPDSFTLAIGHREGETCVVDVLRERKSASPEAVVEEYAALLRSFQVSTVHGDRYGGAWPAEAFHRHGIAYRVADQVRSDLYRDALPVLNSQRVSLPDEPRLVDQFASLERRIARTGRETIDHAPHSHDDLANAVAGLIGLVIRAPAAVFPMVGSYL